jgi:hypothetical protein
MKISKNLHEALVGIRHRSEVRTVWVDQICINQGSLEKKNSQLPLMTFIYGRAKTALLWLGNHKGPRWVEGADELDWSGEWAVAHASRYPLAAKYWLSRLAEEEYWKRTWIIQRSAWLPISRFTLAGSQSLGEILSSSWNGIDERSQKQMSITSSS